MPAQRFVERLNEQIGHEFAAHQQCLAVAVGYDRQTMPLTSGFFYRQAATEYGHAMMMVGYLVDSDAEVAVPGVPAPVTGFPDILSPIELVLEQQLRAADQISELTKLAREELDFASDQFMQWFIRKQVEGVSQMKSLLRVVRRSHDEVEALEGYLSRAAQGGSDDLSAPRRAGTDI